MAFEHKTSGKIAAWGVGTTPLSDESVFVGSHQVSFNGVSYKQRDKKGAVVGLRIWDMELPFTVSGELVGQGAGDNVALTLALGATTVTGSSVFLENAAVPCGEIDYGSYKAYILNFDTSSSRDGVRQLNVSGEYLSF